MEGEERAHSASFIGRVQIRRGGMHGWPFLAGRQDMCVVRVHDTRLSNMIEIPANGGMD